MSAVVKLIFLAALSLAVALVVSAQTWAGVATITSREVPLHGERALAASVQSPRFDLVGLHWQGPGSVEFQTRSLGGRWSAWRTAAPEDEDLPDGGNTEAHRSAGWRLGNPWWVGPSAGIRYRLHGKISRLRAWFVRSPVVRVPMRTTSVAGSPQIVMRAAWQADEAIRRAGPLFAPQLRLAIVHHTAGQNNYTRAEAPAIVRAIELYHVKGNGWNDIGYNFLVDKYGTVYEGRYGGVERNVVGAHAQGFNTGSAGVSVLGSYNSAAPPKVAQEAVAKLLAWRLDIAHVDPLSTLSFISGGNPRFPAGLPVFLREISGHRDTGFTECPGDAFYARLNGIAANVAKIGLPKVYEPKVTGGLGGPVRFRARLSGALPWTVTVTGPDGLEAAEGSGTGATVDWTWDSSGMPKGKYAWSIESGLDATPATGTIGQGKGGVAVPLTVTGVAVDPEAISPNGDGEADAATLTYMLSVAATVDIAVLDPVGAPLATLLAATKQAAGEQTAIFDGLGLPDGTYELAVSAHAADGTLATSSAQVLVSRTLGSLAVRPAAFSPNGDERRDKLSVRFALAGPAQVRVRVLRDGKYVTTLVNGPLQSGTQTLAWDGSKRLGRLLDGSYDVSVEATDAVGTSTLDAPFSSDTHAPVVRVLAGRPLRVWVSEPALLTLRVNGVSLRQQVASAGNVRVAWSGAATHVRVVAWDAAGNVSKPAVR